MKLKYNYKQFKEDFTSPTVQALLEDVKTRGPVKKEDTLAVVIEWRKHRNQSRQTPYNLKRWASHGSPSAVKKNLKWLTEMGAILEEKGLLKLNKDFIPKNQKG